MIIESIPLPPFTIIENIPLSPVMSIENICTTRFRTAHVKEDFCLLIQLINVLHSNKFIRYEGSYQVGQTTISSPISSELFLLTS